MNFLHDVIGANSNFGKAFVGYLPFAFNWSIWSVVLEPSFMSLVYVEGAFVCI